MSLFSILKRETDRYEPLHFNSRSHLERKKVSGRIPALQTWRILMIHFADPIRNAKTLILLEKGEDKAFIL